MSEAQMHQPLLEVKGLKEYFDINMGFFRTKPLKAVDDVSFTINKGETLGLDRKSTRLNSSHKVQSRMPSSA